MVMLAFQRKCMRKGDPRGRKPRVHQGRFTTESYADNWPREANVPEVLPGLRPFGVAEIPHPDCVPADRVLRLTIDHFASENEEFGAS